MKTPKRSYATPPRDMAAIALAPNRLRLIPSFLSRHDGIFANDTGLTVQRSHAGRPAKLKADTSVRREKTGARPGHAKQRLQKPGLY